MATQQQYRSVSGVITDHAADVLGLVRRRIAPEDWVLDEARARRNKVAAAAAKVPGTLKPFPSGSLAHGTVNNPVQDGDLGLPLDRRHEWWRDLGPDGRGVAATTAKLSVALAVEQQLRSEYPGIDYDISGRRAIEFTFNAPMDDEDPSVDLVLCLNRDAPGYWIPNYGTWDAANPEQHTRLMTAVKTQEFRSGRAHILRLAKAAVNGDGEDDRVMCPWNISALGIFVVEKVNPLPECLALFFENAACHLTQHGQTPDPAGVADPIKLPHGNAAAVRRLGEFAQHLRAALTHRDDRDRVIRELAKVFPDQLADEVTASKHRLAGAMKLGNGTPLVASTFGAHGIKTPRSAGDA